MSVLVVDGLEAIQVQKSDGQNGLSPLGLRHRLFEPIDQQASIGQSGQHIVVGQLLQLFRAGS